MSTPSSNPENRPMENDTKICPVCGEAIKAAAIKCRFCNTDLATFDPAKQVETERDLFSGHPAAIYTVRQFLPFLIVIALAVAADYAMVLGYIERSDHRVLYLCVAVLLAFAVIWLYYFAQSRKVHYRITTQRIKLERGVLSKVQESLELFRIDHFELRKPFGSRLLGYSSLHLFSSDAELGNFSIFGVRKLEALADELRECQLRERARRGLTTFVKA
jgi:membrane protein YdbS with pleckstrin-like domain